MFSRIEDAIQDIREGKMVVVLDNEDRENEGDIVMAGDMVTPEHINFMIKQAGGLICTPLGKELAQRLNLNPMVSNNSDPKETAFTVSIDSKECKTGISAFERAMTIKKLCDNDVKAEDFTRPGHIFPLVAKEGGTLKRDGHTEASIDLCRLAGRKEVAIICEIVGEDGEMSRGDELIGFAKEHNLKMITITDLIRYRKNHENIAQREAETRMPTKYGDFKMIGYTNRITGEEHVALVKGEVFEGEEILVRMHSECLTGDAFGSNKCDCGEQLQKAMKRIDEEGKGIILYLRQEGRGIGLINKIKAYALQDAGRDTVDANLDLGFHEDLREYDMAAHMLKDLGVTSINLLTNNPLKVEGLEEYGINIKERMSLEIESNKDNKRYLETKLERMGHLLTTLK